MTSRATACPQGEFAPYTTRRVPLIDVGFVDALKRGRVKVRPALERLTPTGAVFADGTSEPFDAIIAATGFTTGLESLIDVPGVLDDLGEPRGTSGEPTSHPGLYFIGFTHSLRGHLSRRTVRPAAWRGNVRRYLTSQSTGIEGHSTGALASLCGQPERLVWDRREADACECDSNRAHLGYLSGFSSGWTPSGSG